ncbi:catechol 2,3-dioxygenase-like lactoylglutathione lyase family enzyme [Rhodococcus sp. 27YEA15]|uniref:lipase family protein n=1 Tax=Rhodococcus sp. 27YEA15 TaxID=3156259 RepID=UPI003C7BEEA4
MTSRGSGVRRGGWAMVLAGALAFGVGCSTTPESTTGTTTDSAGSVTSVSDTGPDATRGQVFEQQPFAASTDVTATGASAVKILYGSTSGIDGGATRVSGTVFTPAGNAPDGGWPIVSVGHGTTGISDDCAPSASPTLFGTVGMVAALLQAGYVVAVSDFEGLGTPGDHPYLEPDTAAFNVIDAVRAARNVVPDTSTRWASLGASQGGQASWAAAENAKQYGDGLDFVGSANLSPAADVSPIVATGPDVALSIPQQLLFPYLLQGLSMSHPELDVADYVHGAFLDNYELLSSCLTARAGEKFALAGQVTQNDTKPVDQAAADRIHGWLSDIALPRGRADGPMYVVVGGNDNVILPAWTEAAVARACADGDVIEFVSRPGEGHNDRAAVPDAVAWVNDRFAGLPAPSTCGT